MREKQDILSFFFWSLLHIFSDSMFCFEEKKKSGSEAQRNRALFSPNGLPSAADAQGREQN